MPSPLVHLLTSAFVVTTVVHAAVPAFTVQETPQIALTQDVKVPVLLGVMSQCPDAIFCESVFDEVLSRTQDKIDLSLTFIGKYVHRSK